MMVKQPARQTRATPLISLVLALFTALGLSSAGFAQSETEDVKTSQPGRSPIHVQIVLDSSGSMLNNDPRRLSSLAGMMFTDLAGPHDWLGVLSMRKGRFVEERISEIGDRRDRVRESVRSLRFNGATFCAEPLQQAASGLADLKRKQRDARQFVIFLSDGACPDDAGANDVRQASLGLSAAGVKVFSIGLFEEESMQGEKGDPTADLRTMASVTDGEFFRAQRASDLPQRFASILGRIVGSEAVEVALKPGEDATADLDGYIYDASFIVTGSGAPVIVDKADGPGDVALKLPRRARHSAVGEGFYAASHGNGAGRFYSVLRIDEPSAGTWTFKVDGPGNVKGLLIQNYALDPVVELGQTEKVFALGATIELRAWLRGKDDQKIADGKFLEKVDFTLYLTDPDGREHELKLKPADDGVFSANKKLDIAGGWTVRGRARMKSGGLDKRTESARFEVRAATLALAEDQGPIDLGELKAGTSSGPHTVDFGASDLPRDYEVSVKLTDMAMFEVEAKRAELGAQMKNVELNFSVDEEHDGGAIKGTVEFDIEGQSVKLPVSATVVPLTFWERWGRLVVAIAIGLGGLLLLLFIVRGFVSPHRFPADARLNWGETMDRVTKKNEIIIREIQGTKAGFYRNAKLEIGGAHFPVAGGRPIAELEMTGPSQMTIRSLGVELEKVNKFDDSKTKPVDGNETAIHLGEVYRVGDLYLRVR